MNGKAAEPDHADLHLIVDGQNWDQGSGENRNRYIDELEDGASKTYELVVTNIANVVWDSADRKLLHRLTRYEFHRRHESRFKCGGDGTSLEPVHADRWIGALRGLDGHVLQSARIRPFGDDGWR